MMQQMRENTKWIMLITALAFVALMVFEWGMDMSGQSAAAMTGGELGHVNGEPITYGEFQEVYRNLYQRQQQESGAVSSSDNADIEDQAWDQIVMDRLIHQELRRRGIEITENEIRQAARFAPPPEFYQYELFQTDGQFDLEKYHQFLSSASADPQLLQDLENYYRRILPRNKLFQQIASSVVLTDGDLWRRYREQHQTASMDYVLLDPQRVVTDAEVTVTDADVAAYYNEHRSDFERPARAEVRIVAVDQWPTARDTAASLERAREARAEIVEQGEDFADVAIRESDDFATAEQGGTLGTIRRGQMVAPFEEVLWSAPLGQVTEPVQTRFGYHLIRVDERTDSTAEASHILINIQRTLESEDSMLIVVDSLEALVEGIALEAAAEELGLRVRTTELTPLVPNAPGVGEIDEGVTWAFEQETTAGSVSPVFENDRYYYVMELVEREEARELTLEEATPNIRRIVRLERKRERTGELGRQLADQIRGGATLEEAAAGAGLNVRSAGPFTRLQFVPGVGTGNAAIGAAFGLPIGEVSDLVETPDGFYLIRVTDRTPADREAWREQLPQQRQQLASTLRNQRINQFLDALREEANVVDNRDEVLNASPTDQQQRPQQPMGF